MVILDIFCHLFSSTCLFLNAVFLGGNDANRSRAAGGAETDSSSSVLRCEDISENWVSDEKKRQTQP